MNDAQFTALLSLAGTVITVFGGWFLSKGFRIAGRRRNAKQDHVDLERSYEDVYDKLLDQNHRMKTAHKMMVEGRDGWQGLLEEVATAQLPPNELERQRRLRDGQTPT